MIIVLPVSASVVPCLSRQHRTWIALYSLESRQQEQRERTKILQLNQVTEADLVEFEESWLKLRCQPLNIVQ